MAPVCPLLMQARAMAPKLVLDGIEGRSSSAFASVTDGVSLYEDPSAAPGVTCIGSRCAWWIPGQEKSDLTTLPKGRCGQAPKSVPFVDPSRNRL